MAQVDASIPLQVQQPNLVSPLDVASKAMSLRDLQASTQLRNLQVQQGMQTLKDQQELSKIAADPANIDPATGGFNANAVTQITNPTLRMKLQQDRLGQIKDKVDIDYKTSQTAQMADQRKTDALHKVMEESYGTYEDVLARTGNKDAATEAFKAAQLAGYDDIKATGRGGFSKDVQFRLLTPEDVGAKLITHKERVAEDNAKKTAERGEETPFIKEARYVEKLKHELSEMPANDPRRASVQAQIGKVEKHIARLDAPARTTVQMAGGGEGAGKPSPKYTADPEYKQKVDFWAKHITSGLPLPARFAQMVGKGFASDVYSAAAVVGGGEVGDVVANQLNLRQMKSEAQKLGTQSASVAVANKELQKFIPLAEKAITEVPRNAWKPLNQLIQLGENSWSPAQKKLLIANRSVLNAYAQLIQRGAPTVHSLSEAEALLSTADSPAVYKAAMDQLRAEGIAADEGLVEASNDLRNRAKNIGKTDKDKPAPDTKPAVTPSDPAPPMADRVPVQTKWRGHTWQADGWH